MRIFGDKELLQTLKGIQKQIPFATALALTNTAYDIRKETQAKLPQWLNLSRERFVKSQVRVVKATKRNLAAIVGFTDRLKLMPLMERGGTRRPKGRKVAVPTSRVRRGKTGGVTRGQRPKRILSRRNTFIETINGTPGIWRRKGRGKKARLELLYSLVERTSHDPKQIRFMDTAKRVAKTRLPMNFERALMKAVRTAKR